MKKFLVVLVILAVVVTGVFADPVPPAPQSKDLKIFGVIEVGDVNLKVVKTPAEDMLVINLIEDDDVQPSGDGVRVGAWVFTGVIQAENTEFEISYEKTPLTSGNGDSYAFDIIELPEDEQDGYDKYPGEGGLISFGEEGGDLTVTQGLAVKLVSAIPSGAAPGVFEGTITITLTAK